MSFRIRLASNSPLPLFTQVVQQVRRGVARGDLRPGDQLPTVRELAEELVVNPNTIAKSYQELEKAGLLLTRRGAGTFVAEATCVLSAAERERILAEKIDACLTEAVHLGLTRKMVEHAFSSSLEKFKWPVR